MYGGKFGGNFIPETLKKPIDDLAKLFAKLRKDKKIFKERDHYFNSYIGAPTPFIKLENLTNYLGGAKYMQRLCLSKRWYIKYIMQQYTVQEREKFIVGDTGAGYAGKMLSMQLKNLV